MRGRDAERAIELAAILRRIHPRTDEPLNVSVAVQNVHEAADLLESLAGADADLLADVGQRLVDGDALEAACRAAFVPPVSEDRRDDMRSGLLAAWDVATDGQAPGEGPGEAAAQKLPPCPDGVTREAWAKLWNAPILQPGHVYVQHDDEDRTGDWMDGAQVNALIRRLGGWKPEDRWKIDDERPLKATRPDGTTVTFDDYLYEGEVVGMGEIPEDSEDRDGRPPYGRVVRFPDGLWIVPDTDEQERERTEHLLAEAARASGRRPEGWPSDEEAIEILAEHISPYVGEALAGIKREAPHVLDLYRDRARAALADLLARGSGD